MKIKKTFLTIGILILSLMINTSVFADEGEEGERHGRHEKHEKGGRHEGGGRSLKESQ